MTDPVVPAPEVDPRLAERRQEVDRDRQRRRRRVWWALAAVGAVVALAVAATWSPLLDVEEVRVRGAQRATAEDLQAAAGVAPGDPLVWFDAARAEERLVAEPWVLTAEVTRSWGGTVTIEVEERRPAAVVAAADGGWLVADGDGRVLTRLDEEPTDLPVLAGATSTAAVGDTLDDDVLAALAVAAVAPDSLRPALATVRPLGDDVELDLREGGTIALGGTRDAAEKLASAAAVLGAVPDGCVQRLDVSLPSAPALVRAPGC